MILALGSEAETSWRQRTLSNRASEMAQEEKVLTTSPVNLSQSLELKLWKEIVISQESSSGLLSEAPIRLPICAHLNRKLTHLFCHRGGCCLSVCILLLCLHPFLFCLLQGACIPSPHSFCQFDGQTLHLNLSVHLLSHCAMALEFRLRALSSLFYIFCLWLFSSLITSLGSYSWKWPLSTGRAPTARPFTEPWERE